MDHHSSIMQQRRAELALKKAKLEEMKNNRKKWQEEITYKRQSTGDPELVSPTPSRSDSRREADAILSKIFADTDSRPSSVPPRDPSSPAYFARGSRPTSVVSTSQFSGDHGDSQSQHGGPAARAPPPRLTLVSAFSVYDSGGATASLPPQSIGTAKTTTPAPVEHVTYTRGVQTSEPWFGDDADDARDDDDLATSAASRTPRAAKRLSRRAREREEEIRRVLRQEIEEELEAQRQALAEAGAAVVNGGTAATGSELVKGTMTDRFPARALSDEELNAVTSSGDFVDFVERSTKVIERALQEEYDILADYARAGVADDDEDGVGRGLGKRSKRLKEVARFWDDTACKKRMVSALDFSPKFPELFLSAHTKSASAPHAPNGLVNVWNLHMTSRPEYTFHSTSDVLVAKFSPFHPNLILAGCYSGQVLLYDMRSRSHAPVQKSPLTGQGHTHPIYCLDIVGTQNAHNVVTASTDGAVCSWSVDMLAQPQDRLELSVPTMSATSAAAASGSNANPTGAMTEEFAPTCAAFPSTDPTYFLAGSEEGSIYPCHRYDRAGAKAGIDARIGYRGHAAPVMGLDFHPSRGAVDFGDLVLSCGLDWTVKLWRARGGAAASSSGPIGRNSSSMRLSSAQPPPPLPSAGDNAARGIFAATQPLLDMPRRDLVYDVRWSPVKPGVFALVDGAGCLEVWDLLADVEEPVARAHPGDEAAARARGLAVSSALPTSTAGSASAAAASGTTPQPSAGVGGASSSSLPGAAHPQAASGGAPDDHSSTSAAAARALLGNGTTTATTTNASSSMAMGGGGGGGGGGRGSLNRLAWEPKEGRRVAVGGLEGALYVFELSAELGGQDAVRPEEWGALKRLLARLDVTGGLSVR